MLILLTLSFPVTGIDGMCELLHVSKGHRFTLLSYNILDSFCKTGVVTVSEYGVVPTSSNGKTVKIDIVFDDSLVFAHP